MNRMYDTACRPAPSFTLALPASPATLLHASLQPWHPSWVTSAPLANLGLVPVFFAAAEEEAALLSTELRVQCKKETTRLNIAIVPGGHQPQRPYAQGGHAPDRSRRRHNCLRKNRTGLQAEHS